MIARAIMFSTAAALASVSSVAFLASTSTASARPLMLSDLPPDVRALPNARANFVPPHAQSGPAGQAVASAWHQEGIASWYGADHAGRRTSSGEMFNPGGLTAAHATLPLGTRLRVVREDTGASVVVTVNDRIGTHRRVIDLSRGAAEAIGLVGAGLAHVRLMADDGGVIVPTPSFAGDDSNDTISDSPRHDARHTTRHLAGHGRVLAVKATVPHARPDSHTRHKA